MQGELFPQAISEIRAVLANDPKRTDMRTLLAQAYYRNGQKAEAAELCTELLSKYPNCLDANRLMVEIAPGTQRADTAEQYRQRVIELDPYAAFAQDSLFHTESVADNLVTLDRLEYTGETAEMPATFGIGLDTEPAPGSRAPTLGAGTTPGAIAATVPPWLQGTADEPTPAAATSPEEDDIPAFLRKAGWGATSEPTSPEAASASAEPAAAAPEGSGAIEGDLPEWVKALAPKDESEAPAEPAPSALENEFFETKEPGAAQAFAADTPDWLRDLGPQDSAEPAISAPEAPGSLRQCAGAAARRARLAARPGSGAVQRNSHGCRAPGRDP